MQVDVLGWEQTVEDATAAAQRAADAGVSRFWLPRLVGIDPLVTLGVVAARVPAIGLGAGVVPIQTMHPMVVAQQALTLSQVSEGRFTLGVGLSHRPIVEGMWGLPFDRPVTRMAEYLDALVPLLERRAVSATGETVSAHGALDIAAPPVEVVVAALGPQMLRLAGRRGAGTITWMVGPRTLESLTIPELCAAAEAAGRPGPQVIAGFPLCVTTDRDTARERAAARYSVYGALPSYRAMLDREGAAGPEDTAIIGPPGEVVERLGALYAIGVTRVALSPFGSRREREEAWEVIADTVR